MDRSKILMVVALAASIIGSGVVYSYQTEQINNLSSQLTDKSNTIESQNQQILQYLSTLDAQKLEIEDKTEELQNLNARIHQLDAEIATKTAEADILSATVDAQTIQLQALQSQALQLQNEINTLKHIVAENEAQMADLVRQLKTTQTQLDSAKRVKVSHYGLGVTEGGIGVVFPIEVEIIGSGEGTISVDVKNVQYEASFQQAVRTAAIVSSEYADVSVSDKDIIIRFINDDHDLIRVDGGSAGALITGMIIAGLQDRQINHSVLITGTIQSDGAIGRIGGLEDKANAAAEFGAKTILVPEEQKFYHASIRVVGIDDIDDAMRYLAPPN